MLTPPGSRELAPSSSPTRRTRPGAAFDAEPWTAIADWAARRDLWVISDDVYGELVYDHDHVHALRAALALRDRCILVDSVSKTHAMTGWRIGWLAGPPAIVDDATRVLSATITHVPQIPQAAAHDALTNGTRSLHVTKATYRWRRDRAHRALSSVAGVECPLPDGGMFLFPSMTALLRSNQHGIRTTTELATWLLRAHVAVVPGEAFDAPGRLRLNFTVRHPRQGARAPDRCPRDAQREQ